MVQWSTMVCNGTSFRMAHNSENGQKLKTSQISVCTKVLINANNCKKPEREQNGQKCLKLN